MRERRLQIFIVRKFRHHVMEWDAVLAMWPNGEDRSEETKKLLRAMGLVEGMVDLVLLLPGRRIRLIEIKLRRTLRHDRTGNDRAQDELHDLLRHFDFQIDVVRTFREFWQIVIDERIPHRPIDLGGVQTQFDLDNMRGRRRQRKAN